MAIEQKLGNTSRTLEFTGSELCALEAHEAVTLLKKGDISPADLIDVAVERIGQVDEKINAHPTVCAERAHAQADALRLDKTASDHPGWLAGLPLSIKDSQAVGGVRTTFGSAAFRDHIPDNSDPLVSLLEERDGIPLAKSNMPEFGSGGHTFNNVFGTTRNPWDLEKTPGGSTGGGGAALISGQAWLAQGGDLGGSLRTPAAWCGVVGLRPSPGRVGGGPPALKFVSESVHGPMARSVTDCALFLDAMAGFDAENPISYPPDDLSFSDAVTRAGSPVRIAYAPDLGGLGPVSPKVRAVMDAAMAIFSAAGHRIESIEFDPSNLARAYRVLRGIYYAAGPGMAPDHVQIEYKPAIQENIAFGRNLAVDDIIFVEMARSEFFTRTSSLLKDFDVLGCAVTCDGPHDADIEYPGSFKGRPAADSLEHLCFSFLSTLTSLPSVSLPVGFDTDGMPVGLQLISRPRGEAALLAAARACEIAVGGPLSPIDPVNNQA